MGHGVQSRGDRCSIVAPYPTQCWLASNIDTRQRRCVAFADTCWTFADNGGLFPVANEHEIDRPVIGRPATAENGYRPAEGHGPHQLRPRDTRGPAQPGRRSGRSARRTGTRIHAVRQPGQPHLAGGAQPPARALRGPDRLPALRPAGVPARRAELARARRSAGEVLDGRGHGAAQHRSVRSSPQPRRGLGPGDRWRALGAHSGPAGLRGHGTSR